jgi:hypothetical protein
MPNRVILRTLLTLVVAATAPATGWSQSAATVRGTTLTTRVTPLPSEGVLAGMPGVSEQYTTVSISAAGRARTDVIDGSMEPVFSKGSYTLSDATGMVVVQPATKTFFSVSAELGTHVQDMMGMTMKMTDISVKIDTLGDGGAVDGHPTQRYRVTAGYNMSIDMSGMGIDVSALGGMAMPAMRSETVTEYWIARVPDVPTIALGPLGLDAGPGASGAVQAPMMKEFTEKMAAANSALPAGLRLRTTTRMKMSGLPGGGSTSGSTTELSGIGPTDVDLSRLVLPEGYTETLMPGLESLPNPPALSKDGGAKWRIKPGG